MNPQLHGIHTPIRQITFEACGRSSALGLSSPSVACPLRVLCRVYPGVGGTRCLLALQWVSNSLLAHAVGYCVIGSRLCHKRSVLPIKRSPRWRCFQRFLDESLKCCKTVRGLLVNVSLQSSSSIFLFLPSRATSHPRIYFFSVWKVLSVIDLRSPVTCFFFFVLSFLLSSMKVYRARNLLYYSVPYSTFGYASIEAPCLAVRGVLKFDVVD